jgi:hypothetical protein
MNPKPLEYAVAPYSIAKVYKESRSNAPRVDLLLLTNSNAKIRPGNSGEEPEDKIIS